MSTQPARPPTRRPPLGEVTRRVNNAQQQTTVPSKSTPIPHHESFGQDMLLQTCTPPSASPLPQRDLYPPRELQRAEPPNCTLANPLSAISRDYVPTDSNRNSQISTVSTNASDGKRIKSYIGPWKLGKTLGKGATARVRLARHAYTGQEAAIKIVQKSNAQISQAGSLAALDRAESSRPNSADGIRRMPVGIEREVAIMKLIQHPNIMKLYDIWENRTEIYLVLEYVDNGELFDVITANGRLHEEEAMKYFRQILSAVGYCHSFNICHRDLKPENILLTREGEIKVADFGMAALHQSPDHKLKTSCGSPHYAAPELIKGSTYRGDKTDIWSLGVILYAALAGRLPFDVDATAKDWLGALLAKIRKGSYEMAPEFSEDAANLIWRILQVNPRDRISMSQIWRHPAVRKYDYLDGYAGGLSPQSPSAMDCGRPILRRSDINKEILRHLRAMWHRLSEQELMDALLSEDLNDQKLFYTLLLRYRDAQLENYIPDLEYSTSDYHHIRPVTLTKTYSTCHFPQPKAKGHGRQVSRFTVISNVAETERSYDPFKASRPQHLDSIRPSDRATVIIHRSRPSPREKGDAKENEMKPGHAPVTSTSATAYNGRGRHPKLAPPRAFASRSSLASSTRSRNSTAYKRAPVGHKRGVSFSNIRNRSISSQRQASTDVQPVSVVEGQRNHTEVIGKGVDTHWLVGSPPASTRYIRSRKAQSAVPQPAPSPSRPRRGSQSWTEDVRQLSSSLAKDCDEAFNRSSVMSTVETKNSNPLSTSEKNSIPGQPSPLSSTKPNPPAISQNSKVVSLENRPLPAPPARSESVKIELLEARKQAELRKTSGGDESPGYLDRMVSHIDRLIQPSSPIRRHVEQRASSAPLETKHNVIGRPLPSIYEARKEEDSSSHRPTDLDRFMEPQRDPKPSRIASAPEPRESNRTRYNDRFKKPDSKERNTIRVVNPLSPRSPVKIPAPLTIRKQSSQGGPSTPGARVFSPENGSYLDTTSLAGFELRQNSYSESKVDITQYLGRIDEDHHFDDQFGTNSNTGTIVKTKPNWFKRNSKIAEDDFRLSIRAADTMPSQSSSNDTERPNLDAPLPMPPKKKGFSLGRLFKKRFSKSNMTLRTNDIFDDNSSPYGPIADSNRQSYGKGASKDEDPRHRKIETQRNWLAKLFNVKPATKFICFSISKRKARQEITAILKDWKRYGIRDVQIDKERNLVFGKVAAKNFLDMKEVSFAAEIMTVIEHGKRAHLSIARFTQERGAASSFQKVVETLETVMKGRGMLVADERKRRMMIKTLNAA